MVKKEQFESYNQGQLGEQESPLLEQLVDDVLARHKLKKSVHWDGHRYAYTSYMAATDAISSNHRELDEIFSTLIQNTKMTPEDVSDSIDIDQKTWDEFKLVVSAVLLDELVCERYPEIDAENERRMEYWNLRRNKTEIHPSI